MKLFDLHCDTPHRLYKTKEKLFENDLHISLSKAGCFERYIQCSAVWSDSAKSDTECFEDFLKTTDYFEKEAGGFICNRDSLKKCRQGFILTVEDSRLISDDIDRAELLYKRGVRAMTLVWGGRSAVGGS